MILVIALFAAQQAQQWWGQVVTAEHASAEAGTTLYAGDKLSTDEKGTLQGRIRSGDRTGATAGAMFELEPGTTAELEEGPGARLLGGRLTFATELPNRMAFTVYIERAVIRANGDVPTTGQVVYVSPKECLVIARKNSLLVTVGDEIQIVQEGMAYRVLLDEDEQAAGAPPGRPKKAGYSRFLLTSSAFITAATIWAIHEALESAKRP